MLLFWTSCSRVALALPNGDPHAIQIEQVKPKGLSCSYEISSSIYQTTIY